MPLAPRIPHGFRRLSISAFSRDILIDQNANLVLAAAKHSDRPFRNQLRYSQRRARVGAMRDALRAGA